MNLQIHQILPTLGHGDAIGNEVLEIRAILRKWGYKSEIYAQHVHPKLANIIKLWLDYKKVSSSDNILIFHFSNGSDVSRFVKSLPDKKIIIYHNITPPEYFKDINDTLFFILRNGRKELKELAEITDLALGDSEYNRKELVELGFKNTGVLPIIIDFKKYNHEPDQRILKEFDNEDTNFIFVGRLAPNKKQEDVIKIFYYYNKCIDSNSRLFLIGSYNETKKYYMQLKELVKKMDLKNVYIPGEVSFEELLAYYSLSDVFISMSEHEGFCVPLLESMYFGIPIIAYNSTAVPYTLDGAGILINKKRYDEVAELAGILVNDKKFRNGVVELQKLHLERFKKSEIEAEFKKHIEEVLA